MGMVIKMKQLLSEHRKLIKASIILSIIIILYGAVELISFIQYNNRQSTAGEYVDLQEYTEEFKAYDVTGMTQEEINEALDKHREYDKAKEEE